MATAVFGNAALIGVAAAGTAIQPVVGAAIIAGASLVGAIVDANVIAPALMDPTKIKKVEDSSYDNGAGCPHALGLVRTPGQIIWASDPETSDESEGKGKGKSKFEVIRRHIAVAFHRGRLSATPVDSEEPGYVLGQVTDLVKRVFVNGTEMYVTEEAISTTLPAYTYDSIIDYTVTDSSTDVTRHTIYLTLLFGDAADTETATSQLKRASVIIINNGNPLLTETLGADHNVAVLGLITSGYTVQIKFEIYTNNDDTPFVVSDFSSGAWPGGAATITLNAKEIWKKKYFETATQYCGHTNQGLDPIMAPLIQASSPLDVVPAHRGTAYVLFENFNVSDWGGTIPTFEVMFEATPMIQLPDIFAQALYNIFYYGGHDMSMISYPNLYGTTYWPFRGVYWLGPTSAMDKIKDLLAISQFDMLESYLVVDTEEGFGSYQPVIEFRPRGQGASYTKTYSIDESLVSCRKSGDTSSSMATLKRTPNDSVPNHISVSYYSPTIGLLQKTITHDLPAPNDYSALVRNDVSLTFRMTLDDNKAQQYAIQAFWDAQLQKDAITLSLPPNYFDMCPGDLIETTYDDVPITVRAIEIDSGSNGLIVVKGVINDNETGEQILDDTIEDPDTEATLPRLIAVETVPLQEEDVDNLVVYIAGNFPPTTLKKFQIYVQVGGSPTWAFMGVLGRSTFISRIASDMTTGSAGFGILDEQLVTVDNQADMPTGVGAAGATDGYYRYIIGKSLVGVGGDDGTNITRLARGLLGSYSRVVNEGEAIAHMPSSMAGWVRYQLPSYSYVGLTVNVKAVPFGADESLFPTMITHTLKGHSLDNPDVYGLHSYRRDGVSCIAYFYMRVPGQHTVLTTGTPASAAAATRFPYLALFGPNGVVVRELPASYIGEGLWSVTYTSANQRFDNNSATDPTNISGAVRTYGKLGSETGQAFFHIGTNNYYESET